MYQSMGYAQGAQPVRDGMLPQETYDAAPGYGGGSDSVAPPQSSTMHVDGRCDRVVLLATDRECAELAETVAATLKRDAAQHGRMALEVESRQVGDGEHHRDILQSMLLPKYRHMPTTNIFVLSLIKDGNPEEFRTVKHWAQQSKPPLAAHVITCMQAMQDPSLLIRNVCKAVIARLSP
eukprot:TRINITY_DN30932_c0_g1_i1.p1 TRINITY_DN30932_c0_g1~~TRINITY_DN30932_c0_g1_i1.p1  ORF type:complete len:206 (+),score=50.61 TRINITY_DN30932_c0_g1_i1:84-620(+)